MKKVIAAALLSIVAGAATAQAGVNFNVNVDVPVVPAPAPVYVAPAPPPPPAPVYVAPAVPAPPPQLVLQEAPQFIYAPSMGIYVSVGVPYDIVYTNRGYYLYNGGYWYYSPAYWGPWSYVPARRLPVGLRKFRYEQIRTFRDREYRVYLHDREHYRGNWYRPPVRAVEHRAAEHREERREERRDERRDERKDWR